ncbi:MAG TPA: hypothetical protein VGZ73_20045 [Bryobacteraceae bacterium]|jgi:hypothetical protein|nr:hypothetical protein [Bryobacteraceae bacterium]
MRGSVTIGVMQELQEWQPLTPAQLARAEERLRNPRPGSRIEAAQRYGIDLTLLIASLGLSPAERVRAMLEFTQVAEKVRGAGRRVRA